MLIEGAIFDVDGTILDSMPTWNHVCENMLIREGIEPEKGLGDKLFAMTVEMGAEYILENYPLKYSVLELKWKINDIMEEFYRSEVDFKPGAKELLDKLKEAGVKMTIASSTEEKCIEVAFDRLGISDYFQKIFSCATIGITKDRPDIFYMAVTEMGTDIGHTWVFEDGLYSIKTAKSEGFRVAGVYDSVSESDQKEIMGYSDIYLKDMAEFNLV